MNRDIKFRVWDGKRITSEIRLDFAHGLRLISVDNLGFDMISDDKCVLMQFTGLKDKNKKDVYEGDILREPPTSDWDEINYGCYEVFFHDGDANSDYNIGYSINRSHYHGSVCGGYIPSFKPKQVSKMIIIGNIYENPELLK